jgi:hypothetical protein
LQVSISPFKENQMLNNWFLFSVDFAKFQHCFRE